MVSICLPNYVIKTSICSRSKMQNFDKKKNTNKFYDPSCMSLTETHLAVFLMLAIPHVYILLCTQCNLRWLRMSVQYDYSPNLFVTKKKTLGHIKLPNFFFGKVQKLNLNRYSNVKIVCAHIIVTNFCTLYFA